MSSPLPKDRRETILRAVQTFSRDELRVVEKLLDLKEAGVPEKRRSALSRGLVRALEAIDETSLDPLAVVDSPMSAAEAAEALSAAELDAQATRDMVLRDCIDAAEAASRTGRSRQAIERLRRAGRLLALREGHQWRYPYWQFDPDSPGGVLPGIEESLRHLGLSPTGAAFWLLRPSDRLGGVPPIELLRRHCPEQVVQLSWEQGMMP